MGQLSGQEKAPQKDRKHRLLPTALIFAGGILLGFLLILTPPIRSYYHRYSQWSAILDKAKDVRDEDRKVDEAFRVFVDRFGYDIYDDAGMGHIVLIPRDIYLDLDYGDTTATPERTFQYALTEKFKELQLKMQHDDHIIDSLEKIKP